VLRGFPQVFAVVAAVNLGLGSLPPERLKYASGLFNMMRNLGGAVGIAVCGAILNAQTNFHYNMHRPWPMPTRSARSWSPSSSPHC
jgi:MFS transporter, DHA2 family, multidrug resistance protein